jgi:ribosomal protein L37AE/L43A
VTHCPECRGALTKSAPGVYTCPDCLTRGRDGEKVRVSLVTRLAHENIRLREQSQEAQRRAS